MIEIDNQELARGQCVTQSTLAPLPSGSQGYSCLEGLAGDTWDHAMPCALP